MDLGPLTVKERVLLHLFEHQRHSEAYDVPSEVTQSGIAHAVGIRVTHVNQYVKPLLADGRVTERIAHVRRGARKRKVYFLSAAGHAEAARLREALLREEVPFRRIDGVVGSVPLARVYQEERRGTRLLPLLRELETHGFLADAPAALASDIVDFARDAPAVESFYGRRAEIDAIRDAIERVPIVAVTGMAGMGKTSLAAKVLESQRGRRSVFWRQVRPWDTGLDLAARFSAFLAALGRRGLHGYLAGPQAKEWSRIEELLAADVRDLEAFVVFDDVHHATPEAERFLAILHRAVRVAPGPKILLASRIVPTVYTRRDVEVDRAVLEFALKGLDAESGALLLADRGVPSSSAAGLSEACGGVPLFLKLLARSGTTEAAEVERTLESFLTEALEPSLDPVERACLEAASLYEVPVTADGLLFEERARRHTLASLTRKGLLDRAGADGYTTHEFLRAYFANGLSADRRTALAGRVVPWLSGRAEDAARRGAVPEAIAYLDNAIRADVDPARRRAHLEELGDLRRLAGDTVAAIEAYRSALGLADAPTGRAMLHQKLAALLQAQGHLAEADGEIEAGLRLLPPTPGPEADWLFLRRAQLARHRRAYREALEHLDRVAERVAGRAADSDPALTAELANLRGMIAMENPGRMDLEAARIEFQAAADAFEAARDSRGLCRAYNNLGWVAQTQGRREEAIAYLDRSEAVAKAAGDIPGLHTALQTKAWALSEMYGDYERAEPLYAEAYRIAKATQQAEKATWLLWHFAQLYKRQGRYVEGREALEYFARQADALLDPAGRVLYALNPLVRICILCGDLPAAEGYVREALAVAGDAPSGTVSHFLAWAQAILAAAKGDAEAARNAFRRAWDLVSEVSHEGEFCLEYGRFLASLGRAEEAREVLRRAEATLAKLGLEPLREQAERALADR